MATCRMASHQEGKTGDGCDRGTKRASVRAARPSATVCAAQRPVTEHLATSIETRRGALYLETRRGVLSCLRCIAVYAVMNGRSGFWKALVHLKSAAKMACTKIDLYE